MHKKTKEAFDVLKLLMSAKQCFTPLEVKEILNLDQVERRVKDILDGLVEYFGEDIIKKDFKDKKTCYKINNTTDIIFEILLKSDDISFILQDLSQSNPKYLKNLEEETRKKAKKLIKSEKNIFIFKNSIMEDLKDKEKLFSKIKNAVKEHKYLKIIKDKETFIVKAIKLIFTDNNWYLASEDESGKFRFLRISFINDVKPVLIKENNKLKEKKFQKNSVEKYQKYLQNIQNSMTLYGVKPKKAKLLAKKEIAHYFKKDMKKFLSTQKFIEENDKGVIFELSYTQPKEILPFIKKWIPNLLIIEPKELKEEFMSELKAMLKEYSKDFSETIHNSVSVDMIIS